MEEKFDQVLKGNRFGALLELVSNGNLTSEITIAFANNVYYDSEEYEYRCFLKVPFYKRMDLLRRGYFASRNHERFKKVRVEMYNEVQNSCCDKKRHYHYYSMDYDWYNPGFLMHWLMSGQLKPEQLEFAKHSEGEWLSSRLFLLLQMTENKFFSV